MRTCCQMKKEGIRDYAISMCDNVIKSIINTTYLLLLLVVPSPSMDYLSSMPFAGSQLCSWWIMTCQQMTGIMDYVRITCEKGIKKDKWYQQTHLPLLVVDLSFMLLTISQLCCLPMMTCQHISGVGPCENYMGIRYQKRQMVSFTLLTSSHW